MKWITFFALISMLITLLGCESVLESELLSDVDNSVQVFFTNPVEETEDNDLARGLLDFLDQALVSLNIAIHSLSDERVLDILNRACLRGVEVRMVIDVNAFDSEMAQRLSEQCVEIKMREGEGRTTMHHKFAVADGQRVWTGSANWTTSGLKINANNAIQIDNPELAQRFTQVFERLFVEEKFGESTLGISTRPIPLAQDNIIAYFAPHPQLEQELIRMIQQAKSTIRIAMFAYTNDQIHKALLDAMTRGVQIDALWARRTLHDCDVSEIDEMLELGIGRIMPLSGTLHHKFAVIDNALVITGSANWSANGVSHNDENILMIESEVVAQKYQNHFEQLRQASHQYDRSFDVPKMIARHYNTTPGTARIEWHPKTFALEYEVCRMVSLESECEVVASGLQEDTSFWVDEAVEPGQTYYYRVRGNIDNDRSNDSENDSEPVSVTVSDNALQTWTPDQAEAALSDSTREQGMVEFEVKEVFISDAGNVFINAGEDHETDFTAFVPACAVSRFERQGIELEKLEGQRVRVSGELISYQGPEIKLFDSGQLELIQP